MSPVLPNPGTFEAIIRRFGMVTCALRAEHKYILQNTKSSARLLPRSKRHFKVQPQVSTRPNRSLSFPSKNVPSAPLLYSSQFHTERVPAVDRITSPFWPVETRETFGRRGPLRSLLLLMLRCPLHGFASSSRKERYASHVSDCNSYKEHQELGITADKVF